MAGTETVISTVIIIRGRIIDKGTAGRIDGYSMDLIRHEKGKGKLRLCTAGTCWGSERTLSLGIWHYVVVTFSTKENGIKFYINGISIQQESAR